MRSDTMDLHSKVGDRIEDLERRARILREALENITRLRSLPGYGLSGVTPADCEDLLDLGIYHANKALAEAGAV